MNSRHFWCTVYSAYIKTAKQATQPATIADLAVRHADMAVKKYQERWPEEQTHIDEQRVVDKQNDPFVKHLLKQSIKNVEQTSKNELIAQRMESISKRIDIVTDAVEQLAARIKSNNDKQSDDESADERRRRRISGAASRMWEQPVRRRPPPPRRLDMIPTRDPWQRHYRDHDDRYQRDRTDHEDGHQRLFDRWRNDHHYPDPWSHGDDDVDNQNALSTKLDSTFKKLAELFLPAREFDELITDREKKDDTEKQIGSAPTQDDAIDSNDGTDSATDITDDTRDSDTDGERVRGSDGRQRTQTVDHLVRERMDGLRATMFTERAEDIDNITPNSSVDSDPNITDSADDGNIDDQSRGDTS